LYENSSEDILPDTKLQLSRDFIEDQNILFVNNIQAYKKINCDLVLYKAYLDKAGREIVSNPNLLNDLVNEGVNKGYFTFNNNLSGDIRDYKIAENDKFNIIFYNLNTKCFDNEKYVKNLVTLGFISKK